MNTSTIVWLTLLFFVFLMLTLALWFVKTATKPEIGNCSTVMKTNPDVKWANNCAYIDELTEDSTLATPKNGLYLSRFSASPASGPPLGANVWYRYRYVRGKTGEYGKYSPWTKSAIMAGSSTLPCKGAKCDVSMSDCKNNIVSVSVDALDYGPDSGIYANVHRSVVEPSNADPPSDSDGGDLVGMLYQMGDTWTFVDVTQSPCDSMNCKTPGC